jgi:pantoate--beta-alanine ligase
MTHVVSTIPEIKSIRNAVLKDKSVGFIPTMGALHAGHTELLRQARKENDFVVLSLFVNPTQFNSQQDLATYPSTVDQDVAMARKENINCVWVPRFEQIYPDNYKYRISETDFSKQLCGAHREGHFDGVLTVVMRLLNIVKPTRAYFGEKDYQQMQLVKGMVQAFFLDTQIVAVPTVRESSGLALSSRNIRLSPQERERAPLLYKVLRSAWSAEQAREELEKHGFKVDYIQDFNGRRYGAATLGSTRLIDNVKI